MVSHAELKSQSNTGRSAYETSSPAVLMQAEFPDKYTAIFTFQDPKPLFMYTQPRGQPFSPVKFMEQFHADFADKAELDAQVKAAEFETWPQLFNDRNRPNILGRPSLGAGSRPPTSSRTSYLCRSATPTSTRSTPSGNQLPYVDKVSHLLFDSPDTFTTRIVAGEVDYQNRHTSIGNFTLYKESEGAGDYTVVLGVTAGHVAFQPTTPPRTRCCASFSRIATCASRSRTRSTRQEINDLSFNGTATPRQYSPLKQSPQYYIARINAYIEFDAAKAKPAARWGWLRQERCRRLPALEGRQRHAQLHDRGRP